MHRTTKILVLILVVLFYAELPGKEEDISETQSNLENSTDHTSQKTEHPPKIGNFSLPTSQQPAGLFAFGGNIIDKDELQFYLFGDGFLGRKHVISDIIPGILYGVSDDFSIFFNTPFTPYFRYDRHRSRGLEDFFCAIRVCVLQ